MPQLSKAFHDIIGERIIQQKMKGFDAVHDDEHADGELARAAAAYAFSGAKMPLFQAMALWPHAWVEWWNPKSPREDLVRAGALIVAEIERLDRAAERAEAATPLTEEARLLRIQAIMATTPRGEDDLARVYALACGHHETWRPT
tara:strand:+ start:9229 stop:9663 length:435 start_codon:yes stop_codon:yes gene_type:complete